MKVLESSAKILKDPVMITPEVCKVITCLNLVTGMLLPFV